MASYSCMRLLSECVKGRVARSKNIKKAKFGHKQFKKRPNPEKMEKRPNKGQISFKILLK